ncbi:hypothetical protein W03_11940 [Nitrosomonas sp. PY1]|uniref:hypothetical protein n=1 Tax=Nitrosomonas sp. PY1 TaxID=1803906 RepID=UPI001FC837DD|nr:hypothetical protein [Nitrosomonas sp. PY1]GKS69190.1 hypothetical protein W03_11940 [Nitrosomonas sp. PY1]
MIKINKTSGAWICGAFLTCNFNSAFADVVSDTERVLNWLEMSNPQIFSSHPTTQASIEPWLFRYYPEAGIYTGVNKNDKAAYVIGDSWGSTPALIDSLSNLVNQIPKEKWRGAEPIFQQTAQFFDNLEVAISANGDAVAVWLETDSDFSINSVWAVHYNATADTWSGPTLLDSGTQNAYEPKVAMDANGNATVVWMQQLESGIDAWAARFQVNSGWETAVMLENKNSSDGGGFPQSDVAMDNMGNAIVIWSQRIGVQSFIHANRYVIGQGWGSAKSIDLDIPDQVDASFNPKVAVNNNGDAIAVWSSINTPNIRVSHYRLDSNTWDSSPRELGPGVQPEIAISDNGSAIVVAPARINLADPLQVAAWHYNPINGWDPAVRILDQGRVAETKSFVRVAMDARGDAVASWSQLDSSGLVSAFTNYFQNGQWETPTIIEANNTVGVTKQGAEVGLDSSGRAFAVWRQEAQDGSLQDNWASVRQAGTNQWNASSLETVRGSITEPRLAVSSTGRAIAVWLHSDEKSDTGRYLVANLFK